MNVLAAEVAWINRGAAVEVNVDNVPADGVGIGANV